MDSAGAGGESWCLFLFTCSLSEEELFTCHVGGWPRLLTPHTVTVWGPQACVGPTVSSEPLVWETRTHPPLRRRALARLRGSGCGGGCLPGVWWPGGPGGSRATGSPSASAGEPWCSPAAGGLCGLPLSWVRAGAGAVPRRGRRGSGRCSRAESGGAPGIGPPSELRGHKGSDMVMLTIDFPENIQHIQTRFLQASPTQT